MKDVLRLIVAFFMYGGMSLSIKGLLNLFHYDPFSVFQIMLILIGINISHILVRNLTDINNTIWRNKHGL